MSVPLSVLIITGNEEINIRQALDNVCGWADEVFVVDSFSTDRTVDRFDNWKHFVRNARIAAC